MSIRIFLYGNGSIYWTFKNAKLFGAVYKCCSLSSPNMWSEIQVTHIGSTDKVQSYGQSTIVLTGYNRTDRVQSYWQGTIVRTEYNRTDRVRSYWCSKNVVRMQYRLGLLSQSLYHGSTSHTKPLSGLEGQTSVCIRRTSLYVDWRCSRSREIASVLLKLCLRRPGSRGRPGPPPPPDGVWGNELEGSAPVGRGLEGSAPVGRGLIESR